MSRVERYEVMSVALVVAQEEVLAVHRAAAVAVGLVYFLPIFKSLLHGEEGRMGVDLVADAVLVQKVQDFLYGVVVLCHYCS